MIADTHGNVPATRAILEELGRRECESVIHLGDAIGIGPRPSEVLALLREAGVIAVMGNHDALGAFGIPDFVRLTRSADELEHHRWMHAQLSDADRALLQSWPYERQMELGGRTITVVHYARDDADGFMKVGEARLSAEGLSTMYSSIPGDIVLFGHDHRFYDTTVGGRRFINPGSAGCHDRAEARATILTETDGGKLTVEHIAVPYDDSELIADFARLGVPMRDFILQVLIRRE